MTFFCLRSYKCEFLTDTSRGNSALGHYVSSVCSTRLLRQSRPGISAGPLPIPGIHQCPADRVLGPCLFLAYINELQTECWDPAYSWHTSTTCRQNAGTLPIPGKRQSLPFQTLSTDDTILYRLIICVVVQDPAALQDLHKLEQWEKDWEIPFHPDKGNRLPIIWSKKNSPQQVDHTLHGQILETVRSVKKVDVTLQCDLEWGTHISNVCAKANRMLGFLRRNLKVCSAKIKGRAYKALIRPITEYACHCSVGPPQRQAHLQP